MRTCGRTHSPCHKMWAFEAEKKEEKKRKSKQILEVSDDSTGTMKKGAQGGAFAPQYDNSTRTPQAMVAFGAEPALIGCFDTR